MSKIILYMFVTLDGYIAGPNGEFDDYEPSAEEMRFANQLFGTASGIIFGRKTYEGFVDYWDTLDISDTSTSADDTEFATRFRKMQRIVISRSLDQVKSPDILIKTNIAENLIRLKEQAKGDLLLICGPTLVATLVESDLINEYLLLVKPRVLGQGTTLFRELKIKQLLTLKSVQTFESGCVLQHYEVSLSSSR